MEALAALGLACNILDNIDRACKYVKKTKEIYDSAMGLSGEVENLVEVVKTMAQVTEEMQKLQPRVLQSTADQAMCEVIGESLQLTKDINALMLSCLPKTEHSWLSAAAATIRSRRKRSELATLEKTLREKFQILNSSVITKTLKEAVTVKQLCGRLDTKLEFSRAQQFSSDKTLCSITTQLEHMERDLTAHYSELRGLVHSMRQTTDDVKIASILQALHFDTIHRRFREVADSEIGTFGWIINDPTRQMKLQDELKVAFPDWLKTGEGVFHIAGKPGSGKSTLMKFICKHKQVDNLLEEWAGPRELLSVKFFFWKVGALEQRSLFGLIQGLLFAVIEKAPTLAKTLFSEVWQPNRSRLAGSSPLNLTDQEITAALEKLTKDRTLLERYRICIFVDGLDEFEPDSRRGTTHASLVRRIQEWTRNAAGGVKWCVSSREEPVFETMFSASQRITIQNFTRPDVEELIRHRFAENEIFAGIRQAHTERFQSVVNTVLEDADGVFLWVVLLLTQFEESVANGDGIDLVEQILKKAPTELESFFQAILDSVPEHYRDGAYTLLAIALRMQGTLLDSPDLVVLDGVPLYNVNLELDDAYWFFQLWDRGDLAKPTSDIPWLTKTEYSWERNPERRQNTVLKIKARCKGLLDWFGESQYLVFTHRSIPEFLGKALVRREGPSKLNDHIVLEKWVSSNIADMTSGLKDFESIHQITYKVNQLLLLCRQNRWTSEVQLTTFRLLHMFEMQLLPLSLFSGPLIVLTSVARIGLHEYISWAFIHYPEVYGPHILLSFCSGYLLWRGYDYPDDVTEIYPHSLGETETLEIFLDSGVSANAMLTLEQFQKNYKEIYPITVWHFWVVWYLYLDPGMMEDADMRDHWYDPVPGGIFMACDPNLRWKGLEVWLRHNVDPDVSFLTRQNCSAKTSSSSDGCSGGSSDSEEDESFWCLEFTSAQGTVVHGLRDRERAMTQLIAKLVNERGGARLTLEDLVNIRKPSNRDELIRLIHRNRRLLKESGDSDTLPATVLPSDDIAVERISLSTHADGEQGLAEGDVSDDSAVSNSLLVHEHTETPVLMTNGMDREKPTLVLDGRGAWFSPMKKVLRTSLSMQGLLVSSVITIAFLAIYMRVSSSQTSNRDYEIHNTRS